MTETVDPFVVQSPDLEAVQKAYTAQYKATNDEVQARADSRAIAAGKYSLLTALVGSIHPLAELPARLAWALAQTTSLGIEDEPQTAQPLPKPVLLPAEPPTTLDDAQAVWYLSELLAEFGRHGWPQTIQGAKDHWVKFGRADGRKWAADSPGWGPAVSKDDPRWAPKV